MNDDFNLTAALLWVVLIAVYFLPALLAYFYFQRRQSAAIIVLNFLLGWTIIGWVMALVWVFVEERE